MTALRVPVSSSDHIRGDPSAPLVLLEYGDYECPYCGLAHPITQQVLQHYGRQLKFVFRNFPLTEVHPHAESAAETAEFAAAHGRFWEMHDLIYENQERLSLATLLALAKTLGLPIPALRTALEQGAYREKVRRDFLGGARSGVNGTPTFFIDGHKHIGAFDFESLRAAIDRLHPYSRVGTLAAEFQTAYPGNAKR